VVVPAVEVDSTSVDPWGMVVERVVHVDWAVVAVVVVDLGQQQQREVVSDHTFDPDS
jgi:hypothetical protein